MCEHRLRHRIPGRRPEDFLLQKSDSCVYSSVGYLLSPTIPEENENAECEPIRLAYRCRSGQRFATQDRFPKAPQSVSPRIPFLRVEVRTNSE